MKQLTVVNQSAPLNWPIRLTTWWGVYLASQIPVYFVSNGNFGLGQPFIFPFYLGSITAPICNLFPYGTWPASCLFILGFYIFPYAFYVANLYGFLKARTRRRSFFVLLILVLTLIVNLVLLAGAVWSISD